MVYEPQYTDPEKVRQLISRSVGYQGSTAASLDDTIILQAIADAEGEVDGVLRKSWTLPLSTPVPQLVVTITEAIAAYNADLVFRGATPYRDERSPIYLRLKRAHELLKMVDDGQLDAGVILPDGGTGTGDQEAVVINPYSTALFGPSDFFWWVDDWMRPYWKDAHA